MARVVRTTEPTEYRNARRVSSAMNESNDCAVVAITLATGVAYDIVHSILKKHGRKNRKGTNLYMMKACLIELGFNYRVWSVGERVAVIHQYPGQHKGLSSITTHHPRRFAKVWARQHKNLFFFTSSWRHVLAVKDGEVQDYTVNKAQRIEEIWEISRKV